MKDALLNREQIQKQLHDSFLLHHTAHNLFKPSVIFKNVAALSESLFLKIKKV